MGLPFAGHKDNHAGLMTQGADGGVPRRDGHPPRPRMGPVRGAGRCRRTNCGRSSTPCPFATPLTPEGRALTRAAGAGAGRRCRRRKAAGRKMSTQAGFGDILAEIGRGQGELQGPCRAYRHHRARRDGLDQSRPVGEPARHLRPAHPQRRVPRRQAGVRAALGHVAEGPAHRARHRRAEPVPAAGRGRAGAGADRRAAAADRHGVRSVRQPRPRCADLRLLPGRAVPAGLHAVRA